ncbi:isoaspartyl peptidase/L-asparaginase [Peribacillus sp. V2I11]|uniref:isoaspartyl peptidase/L-asparaginase n=1 Tax=Peribacillus sp. V2I11 TaxID=3042277 RepID=UPI002787FE10|nr:isoaspartyl peptidase/L-asparaginase [Peribacillus sp. V2I11]MDQ0884532.1 hypothetical protein [Peribacillus sp. V2I11]
MSKFMLGRWGVCALAAVLFFSFAIIGASGAPKEAATSKMKEGPRVILAIHGGAGGGTVPKDQQDEYRNTMRSALDAGKKIVDSGGSSVDAVEAAVRVLEDSPLFNAGKGAAFNAEGFKLRVIHHQTHGRKEEVTPQA